MTTQPKASASSVGRIVSLDLMRGWFLIIIILDHLTYFPNGLTFLTGDSRLAVSAAEGFFIISGLVLGIVRGASDAPTLEAGWYALPHEHYRDDTIAPD